MKKLTVSAFLLLFCLPVFSQEKEKEAPSADSIFRKIGLSQSQVSDLAWQMTDGNGPRVTGSPGLDKATKWAVSTLKSWKMDNVHTEEWGPFGRGWELKNFQLEATEPYYFPIDAWPKVWSPSVKNGPQTAEIIYLDAGTEKALENYKGKLKGKIVLLDTIRAVKEWEKPLSTRLDAEKLLGLANEQKPLPSGGGRRNFGPNQSAGFGKILWNFLYDEQPLAILDRSFKGDYGTIFVSGGRARNSADTRKVGEPVIPQITVAIEHYNRLFRMAQRGQKVSLRLALETQYKDDDPMERNIIAEIPGTDLKEQVVMFGAHFDSWQSGTGATDNGAGSAMMMEAARILQEYIKETGQKPRRTLRLALWTGEEQGLLGSRDYCNQHFVVRDSQDNITGKRPENEKVSAYFNLDNGTGKIRGVHLQGNEGCGPIFREWLEPWEKHGASTLTLGNTGGTDHLSFDRAGIPGFQFIQDPCEYDTRTHHSNFDTWEHLFEKDMKQAATITAWFVWQTAMRDEMLPRKP